LKLYYDNDDHGCELFYGSSLTGAKLQYGTYAAHYNLEVLGEIFIKTQYFEGMLMSDKE